MNPDGTVEGCKRRRQRSRSRGGRRRNTVRGRKARRRGKGGAGAEQRKCEDGVIRTFAALVKHYNGDHEVAEEDWHSAEPVEAQEKRVQFSQQLHEVLPNEGEVDGMEDDTPGIDDDLLEDLLVTPSRQRQSQGIPPRELPPLSPILKAVSRVSHCGSSTADGGGGASDGMLPSPFSSSDDDEEGEWDRLAIEGWRAEALTAPPSPVFRSIPDLIRDDPDDFDLDEPEDHSVSPSQASASLGHDTIGDNPCIDDPARDRDGRDPERRRRVRFQVRSKSAPPRLSRRVRFVDPRST